MGDLARSDLAVCAFESRLPHRFRVGRRRPQRGSGPRPAGSSPAPEAMPPRTAAAPLSYSGRPGSAPGGGSPCSYSNRGREGGLSSRRLRVRLPPSTPPSTPGIMPTHLRLLSGNGKHASSVRRQPGFDSPSRLFVVHAELAQPVEAPRLGRGGSRFESVVRHYGRRSGQACRAPLLADARVTPCRSSRPPSSHGG